MTQVSDDKFLEEFLNAIPEEDRCSFLGHPYDRDDHFPGEQSSFGRCACGVMVYPNKFQRGDK